MTSLSFLGVLALPLPLPLPLPLRCSLSELPVELIPLDSRGSTLASVTGEETKGGWIAEYMCDEQCIDIPATSYMYFYDIIKYM